MIIFSVRALRPNFEPTNLNNNNDVVGFSKGRPAVILADGTLLALPAQVTQARDISDNGVVLGDLHPGEPALIDIGTMSVDAVACHVFLR